ASRASAHRYYAHRSTNTHREPTVARPEVTGRRPRALVPDFDAMSVDEFCRRHSISKPLYYALQRQGRGPDVMYAGQRVLITREAAKAWRLRETALAKRVKREGRFGRGWRPAPNQQPTAES